MLLSLVLYGSRARGDHRIRSDVDLLGVIEGRLIEKEISARGASFYSYPAKTLLEKSKSGDLFVLHLVQEGKVLHDTVGFFESVQESFRYKKSYHKEITQAQAVIKFFESRPSLLNKAPARKRLVWGIRTLIVARSAEQQKPIFSSRQLERFSNIEGLKELIDNRNTADVRSLIDASSRASSEFGLSTFDKVWPESKLRQKGFLRRLGGVAEDTLRFLPKPSASDEVEELTDEVLDYPF